MAKKANSKSKKNNEKLEQTLFKAADKLRKNMDAAEYKQKMAVDRILKQSELFAENWTSGG